MTSVAVDARPHRTPNPWWVAVVCGMASYIDACAIVSNGIALVLYQHSIGLTDGQIGGLSGGLTFAIATGALFGGRLGDRFGRRPVFQFTMLLTIAGALLMIFGTNFMMMLLGIILMGLGTGADLPVSLATISEAGNDKNRGALLGLSQILWTFGILGAVGISIVVGNMGHRGGQLMYAQIVAVCVLVFLGRMSIPESDSWKDARIERQQHVATERAQRASLGMLLKPPYLVPLLALVLFYSLVNLGANTGGQFSTFIWVNVIGKSVTFASTIGLVFMPLGLILGVVFMRTVNTRWRMPLFYLGMVSYVLGYALPALLGFTTMTMIISTVLGGIGGCFAFEAIMKVWAQEKFPTLLRSTAQGTIISVARYMAGAFALFTPGWISAGIQTLYWVITGIVVVGYAFALWGLTRNTRNEFDEEVKPEHEHFETAGPADVLA